uniref:NADH-ubiquinone oxidoreductase chain 2 n=1 Tax=Stenostomum sthenum TaxID=1611831 RepID=A0A1Z1M001_9PLAT|nr:NADH dehydrogenase subunit 2 [Stenostomum sthenum]ARW59263.1 NADH dehydrogenase subunit 2 [Stenostomum sthenum]
MKESMSHAYLTMMMKTYVSSTVLLILSLIFLVSSSSPIFFWMMLELNLMFVLFLMFEDSSTVKAMICYFIFQVYGSLLFIYGFMSVNLMFLAFLGLSVKFGLFPFHVWQPYVFTFSSWKTCFIIAGPQKAFLILLFIFFNMKMNDFIMGIIILTVLIVNLYLVFLYDLKKTFAFLSISSATWLFCLISWSIESNLWFLYLYNIQLLFMFVMFMMWELQSLESKKYLNMLLLMFIVSYSGIPPMIGFFMKLQILNFFFFFYQSIPLLLLFTMIMIPSTFFLVYYSMTFFLKKKMIMIQHVSLFYITFVLMFFMVPSFYIFI